MLRTILMALLLGSAALAQTAPSHQYLLRIEPLRKDFTLQNVTEAERQILAQHGAYLHGLFAKGTLTFAGQAFDPKGLFGIIIVTAPDAETAAAILNADPTIVNNVFRGDVIPFRTVFERGVPAAAATGK
jgi:uncharacterized protein YciI